MFELDEKFLILLKKQDKSAFNKFYLETVDMFFRYIQIHYYVSEQDINDIISSFYLKQREAFKNLNLKQSASAYIWTIFKNTIKDYFKKQKDIPFSYLKNDEESQNIEDTIEYNNIELEQIECNLQSHQIKETINKLDNINKDIIYLKYIEGKSNQEISDVLQISQDNVRQRLSRSIKQLKDLLNNTQL